jgi:hypothetical protein
MPVRPDEHDASSERSPTTNASSCASSTQRTTGNAVKILAFQLIASKLNALEGCDHEPRRHRSLIPTNPYNGFTVDQLIVEADNLIGGPTCGRFRGSRPAPVGTSTRSAAR